jgi:predicted NUDIX family phosphoesterase
MMIEDPELVYVVARADVFDGPAWHGVRREASPTTLERLVTSGRYVPRPLAEIDPSLKQIIPYLVLRDGERVFLMRRTKAGGDARLHDRYSIGIGGHLNPGDGGVLGGLYREWHEEIEASFEPSLELLGLLNDDTTEVGAVHLGVIFVADAGGRPVAVRETDKLTGAFADGTEVEAVRDDLETWSQLAFDALLASDRARVGG